MTTAVTFSPTREASGDIQGLNRWIFETIEPFIKGRTLEIDSGTNSLCSLFIEYNRPIHLSDTNEFHLQTLRETYKDNRLVRAVHDFDLMAPDFQRSHPETLDVFDTILALNLSPADFGRMMDNIKYVLPQEGTLVVILPAYTSIYHGLDQNLDDWKRYNGKVIRLILMHKFSILKVRYFNFVPDVTKGAFPISGLSALVTIKKI